MVVGDRRDEQFVGTGGLLELFQLVGHPGRGAGELGVDPVLDEGPVLVGPRAGARFLRCRERDGALGGADAADPRAVAGGEFAGGGVVGGDHDVGGDADVGLVQELGGLEEGAVALHRLQDGGRADVIVGGETQPARPRDLGAEAAAAAQDPHLHVGALARYDVRLDALRGAVGAGQQGEDVVDLLGVVLRHRARQQEQLALQRDAGRPEEVLEGEAGRDGQAVRGAAVDDRGRGRQRRRGLSGWAAAGAAQAEVEAPGVQGVDEAELLDRGQRGAVSELYGPGAEPDGGGGGRGQGQEDGG
ncbi:hypothetical protein GCM10020295_78030 [Streptomyces cinereospinus]